MLKGVEGEVVGRAVEGFSVLGVSPCVIYSYYLLFNDTVCYEKFEHVTDTEFWLRKSLCSKVVPSFPSITSN